MYTPWKTNMDPENHWLEEENNLPGAIVRVYVRFRECIFYVSLASITYVFSPCSIQRVKWILPSRMLNFSWSAINENQHNWDSSRRIRTLNTSAVVNLLYVCLCLPAIRANVPTMAGLPQSAGARRREPGSGGVEWSPPARVDAP